jgi:hypothetical protein
LPALERFDAIFHAVRVDANGANRQRSIAQTEALDEILPQWVARLDAHARHVGFGVVARQRRQIDALNDATQPR